MVSQKEKQHAMDFIAQLLEQSEGYALLRKSEKEVLVQEKHADGDVEPKTIKVVLANALPSIKSFDEFQRANRQNNIYTAPVLYKDGKTAFVRMVDRNISWRTEKSLKNYTGQEINQMLHLRGIEKAVMGHFDDKLIYYQPKTNNLEQSLRKFHLGAVDLDYSHIDKDHQAYGFAENREAIDYKLPQETEKITGSAIITFTRQQPDNLRRAWLAGLEL